MPDKITLQNVASIDNTLITAINNNNAILTAAIDNTLSRDGTSPNQMGNTLDMNSKPIINIPFATNATQPVALGQIANPVSLIPALTGDVTGSFNGTTIPTTLQPLSGDVTGVGRAVTFNTVNSSPGSFGSTTTIPVVTVNGKGLVTASSSVSNTPTNVANSQLATMVNNTVKGNVSGGTATPSDLTTTQLTTLVNTFTSGLSGAAPASGGGSTNFLRADGTWNAPSGGSGGVVSYIVYTTSQTITIPATATKAYIKMWGGTGGSGGVTAVTSAGTGSTGAAGYLEKLLTGLTPGNTLVWTQGAAGSAGANTGTAGGNGGASSLASGTQTISTLTANGSNGSNGTSTASTTTAGTAGGTATGGDLNLTGINGVQGFSGVNSSTGATPGIFLYSIGAFGVETSFSGPVASAGNAGNAGTMTILWLVS